MSSTPRIHPVLLSGGSGSRLWPISRETYPKQLLPLASDRSMLQDTVARVAGEGFASPLIICNQEHRFLIAEQMRAIGVQPSAIILEPFGRNTAAAVVMAALQIGRQDPEALLLILPADHVITDGAGFQAAVGRAAAAAAAGCLATFGVVPTGPETGYGYIRQGAAVPALDGVFRVASFVEKPQRDVAERLVAGGEHFWNSGMFLFPAALVLSEMERYEPELVALCRDALEHGAKDLDFLRLDAERFGRIASISVDYALMERTDKAAVVPASFGWTDVGAWPALWDVSPKDADGNVLIGDVLALNSRNSYVRSDEALVAVLGLDDVVVVATEDAILVTSKDHAQNVKAIVEQLKKSGRPEPTTHRRVYRPWGYYQGVHQGDRFQVKRLTVNPGAKLSLQKHFHRAEHWVVVNGTALVTRDTDQILLRENESVYIPLGAVHRLENPGRVPLNLIEVQSGSYLGEDDIVRIDDTYGRN